MDMPNKSLAATLASTTFALLLGSSVAATDARADVYASTTNFANAPTHYIPGTGFVAKGEDQGHRYRFIGQMLGTAYADRVRLGAEIELSKYEAELAGLPAIQVKSYNIRALLQFVFFPNQLSPYCGGGLGVEVMRFDDDQVESVISRYQVDKFGIAMGGVGFIGVQLPVTENVTLYAEGRASAAFQLFSAADVEMGAGIYDGLGGLAGLRMRF